MEKKFKVSNFDLIVIYNIFGDKAENFPIYVDDINSLLGQRNLAEPYKIHVVVSAYKSSTNIMNSLKEEFGSRLQYCEYFTGVDIGNRSTEYMALPVQCSFNKTAQVCVDKHGMPKAGFGYISSGVKLRRSDILKRAIDKIYTGEYGVIQFQCDIDHAYQYLGAGPNPNPSQGTGWRKIDFTKDYIVPVGCCAAWHSGIFHHEYFTTFDKKISPDIFGGANFEQGVTFSCASIGKTYILMGNSETFHRKALDGTSSMNKWRTKRSRVVLEAPWLLFGRTHDNFKRGYNEAKHLGFGFLPDTVNNPPTPPIFCSFNHDKSCFDEKHKCKNNELKKYIRKYFFTNDSELDYEKIPYTFI